VPEQPVHASNPIPRISTLILSSHPRLWLLHAPLNVEKLGSLPKVHLCFSYDAQDKKRFTIYLYSINDLAFVQKDMLDYTGKSSEKGTHYGF
jgi:hypothetical protein